MATAAVTTTVAAAVKTTAAVAAATACALGEFQEEIPAAQIIWETPTDAAVRPAVVTMTRAMALLAGARAKMALASSRAFNENT